MKPPSRPPTRAIFLLALAAGTALAALPPAPAMADNAAPPYTIKDGRVDQATFNGYRRYTESCLRCHGPDGAGSSYAPNLTDSLKTMSQEQFGETVINGRKNVSSSNQNVMPAFGNVEDVALYLDDIYAYLKARSDGVLGRGRPKRASDD